MTNPLPPYLKYKLVRISLHLACLFIYPINHIHFHLAGIMREFHR